MSKKTGLKIETAIKKLNYKPNLIARSLVIKKSNCLGLILGNINNPYYGEIITGVEDYISDTKLNYTLILCDVRYIRESTDKYVELLLDRRVDGILSTSENISSHYINYLKKNDVPIVFIGCYKKDPKFNFSYITIDDEKGGYLNTENLLKNNHRNIYYINVPIDSSFSIDRANGFKKALKEFDIKINENNIINCNNLRIEDGYIVARKIFEQKVKPTAIICINDAIAYGVMDYCFKNNIKIPDDVSITSFDDDLFSSLSFVNLTTVREPKKDMGYQATEILFNKIINSNKIKIIKIIEPELIVRGSVKYLNP